MRGFAILLVTLFRFGREAFPGEVYGRPIERLIEMGSLGVDLFFVLSGFLITRILLQSYGNQHYFSRFYYRRSLRIFPLYFATLAVLLIALPAISSGAIGFPRASDKQFYLWTYTTNLKMSWDNQWGFGYLDHFWSLAVEEQFYLAWPLVVFFFPARVLRIAVFGAVGCAVARALFCFLSENTVAPDVFTLFRCDGLLLGASIAALWQLDPKLPTISQFARPGFIGCVAILALAGMMGGRNLEIPKFFVACAWTCFLIMVLSPKQTITRSVMSLMPLQFLGRYSYAMYVFQSPLIPLMNPCFSASGFTDSIQATPIDGVAYVVAMFLITLLAAMVSWHGFESIVLRYRNSAFAMDRD